MPIKLSILNQKFFNQLKNGADFSLNTSDFAPNLVGNVGEKVKTIFYLRVEWYAQAGFGDVWNVQGTSIERNAGNFIDDGFFTQCYFEFYADWRQRLTSSPTFTAQVDFISSDGLTLQFTVLSGAVTPNTLNDEAGIWAVPLNNANNFNGAIYRFGLASSDESKTFTSKVSGNTQEYFTNTIDRTISFKNILSPKGTYKDWESGSSNIALIVEGNPKNVDTYKIEHEFEILPDYLVGELSNLQNVKITDLFKNDLTLNYNFELELRHNLTNNETAKLAPSITVNGSIGWFNENFNGFNSDYSVVSTNYLSGSTLDLENSNTVTITIKKLSGTITSGVVSALYFSYLPDNEDEYTDKTTTIQENFVKDSILHTEGTAASIGTGIIKSYSTTISGGGDLLITATLEFNADQQLQFSNTSYYRLSVNIEDQALTAVNSDRVHLLADVNQFSYDQSATNTGLMSFTKYNFLNHIEVLGVDSGLTSIDAWNEDGIVLDFEFTLDTNRKAFIDSLSFKLVAYDGTNFFLLDNTPIDLTSTVVASGIQRIEVDTTKGYKLNSSSQFNKIKITTGSEASGVVTYTGNLGFKIKWQDWIENLNVDTAFYDISKLQNNLNFKSSNYSNGNSYKVFVLADSNLSGIDTLNKPFDLNYKYFGGELTVYDYDESNDGEFVSGTIQTLDPDSFTDLGGKILTNKNTIFRITWDSSSNLDVSDIRYIIHRIQPFNSTSDDIEESSTTNGTFTGGILQTASFLKVGNYIVSESTIDFTKLESGKCYNISGRIQALNPVILGFLDYECETIETTSSPTNVTGQPEKPFFCGNSLESSQGQKGITQYGVQINYTGWIGGIFSPQTVTDMANIGKLQSDGFTVDYLATTHMTNADPTLDIYANVGLIDGGANIDGKLWTKENGYIKRFLDGKAQGSGVASYGKDAVIQYIGDIRNTYPNRIAEYQAETGDMQSFDDLLNGEQLIWMPVDVGDIAVFMASGASGTIWRFTRLFCYIDS